MISEHVTVLTKQVATVVDTDSKLEHFMQIYPDPLPLTHLGHRP